MSVDILQILKWYTTKDIFEYEKCVENNTIYYRYKYIEDSRTHINKVSISDIEAFKEKYDI